MMEWVSGNVFIRSMGSTRGGLVADEKIIGHTHNFDHTTIFFNGRWQVKRWSKLVDEQGEQRIIDNEPAWVIMKAIMSRICTIPPIDQRRLQARGSPISALLTACPVERGASMRIAHRKATWSSTGTAGRWRMSELLFMAHDHSTEAGLSDVQLAALPTLYDLTVGWEEGAAIWGSDDLASPWFRIINWIGRPLTEFNQFLVPMLPELDADLQPTTYEQYRAFFINIAAMPPDLQTWFADDARTAPKFVFDDINVTPDSLKVARPPLPIT
jgi:hypothetical protein